MYIYVCVYVHIYINTIHIDFDSALAQGIDFESKGDKLSSSVECSIRTLEVWDTKSPADIYIYGIYIYADLNYHPYPKILLMFTSLNLMLPTTGMCYQLYISDHFYYTSTVPHITTQYAYRYSVIEWGALKYYLNISNN